MGRLSAGRRVLVVDDDPDVRAALGAALGAEGYDVRAQEHGRDALDLLLGGDWAPDLIILDLAMPVMGGPDFRGMQLAAEEGAPVRVIVLSAVGDLAEAAAPLDPAAVIAKPFDLDELLGTVRRLLG